MNEYLGIEAQARKRIPEGWMYLSEWTKLHGIPNHYAYYATHHKGLAYLRHYGRQIIKASTTLADVGYPKAECHVCLPELACTKHE